MQNSNDLEAIAIGFELIIDALKAQNEELLKSVKDFLTTLIGSEQSTDILTAALFELSETQPDVCRWALRTFSRLNFLPEITEGAVVFAVKKLISKGFILGQDFSVIPTGGIFITKNAQAALLEGSSASDRPFFEEISHVFE